MGAVCARACANTHPPTSTRSLSRTPSTSALHPLLLLACQGVSGAGCFRLWHWDAIDSFVYFSHHLVSVPPPGWVHAAHKHGVKVGVELAFHVCLVGVSGGSTSFRNSTHGATTH
jgi:hypothetical protein